MSARNEEMFWDDFDQIREFPVPERVEEWVLRAPLKKLAYRPERNGLWHNGYELTTTAMSKYHQLSPPAKARLYAANPLLMEHGQPLPQVPPGRYSQTHRRLGQEASWTYVRASPPIVTHTEKQRRPCLSRPRPWVNSNEVSDEECP